MKKKLLLLVLCLCFIPMVKAVTADGKGTVRNEKLYGEKYVLAADIPTSSYVIGKAMYTRQVITGYDGVLTTQRIMQASKSLDYLESNTIYYKKTDGSWIDALTGTALTVPTVFEIQAFNGVEVMGTPEMDCDFSLLTSVKCSSSISIADTTYMTNYPALLTSSGSSNKFDGENPDKDNYKLEFYVLKNADGTLASSDAVYREGEFIGKNNEKFTPVQIDLITYSFASNELQQIVSRFYYPYADGDVKLYSEYSNIETNGAYAVFGLNSAAIKLDATINDDYAVNVESNLGTFGVGINSEVNFYNVKFKLGNVDTTRFMIKEFRVYSAVSASDAEFDYIMETHNSLANIEGGSDTLEYLYLEETADDKYTKEHRFHGGQVISYMIAHIEGYDAFGTAHDVSNMSALSKRLYNASDVDDNESREIVARATVCDLEQNHCYTVRPHLSSATGNQSYVR